VAIIGVILLLILCVIFFRWIVGIALIILGICLCGLEYVLEALYSALFYCYLRLTYYCCRSRLALLVLIY
jgi:hypothetical protein